jgi:N-acetyl-1-D-myo-inositol-2-amino-2-deoxy-alpha-D-glucopyranoside deacetylase
LVTVVAHPDDDTFACSGTVALHADEPGFRFTLVHVTSGEGGMISDPSLATRANLGAVREDEDRRSWIALGRVPDRHEFLRYPDGGVADVPFDELVDRVAAILREERPDVVITFGPEGVTGHADHITVGEATTEAFRRCRREEAGGFERLLYSSIPDSMIERFNEGLVASGKEPIDPTQPFQPRGVPDVTIGVDVDCSSVVGRKRAAIRAHRTQANDFSDELEDEVFRHEPHVIGFPERLDGSAVLRDVFEGLD